MAPFEQYKAEKYLEPAKNKPIVLMTGASGLIGSALTQRLQDTYQVVGLDKTDNVHQPAKVEYIGFDITDEQSIGMAMARVGYVYGSHVASVIHLAAYYDFAGKPSPLYEEVTVKGTEKLLKALGSFEVEQFVFSSTNLVYRPTIPGKKITEEWPLVPSWDYPRSKIDTEQIIHINRGNIPAVVLRLAGVYTDEGNSIPISQQIQRIYERTLTSHFFSGDVSHGNVFLHMDDLVTALAKIIAKRDELPKEVAINIGEPVTPSYQQLQQQIGRLIHGEEWKTFELPKPLAKVGAWVQDLFGDPFIKPWMIDRADDHFELDISRARSLLGWEPQRNLMSTLNKIVGSLKADPVAWYEQHRLDPSGIPAEDKPARIHSAEHPDTPPGWDYNPSKWGERIPIIVLALAGTVVAGYLALYQLEVINDVWEPFFGNGSRTILNSEISDILPIPDAALGAIAYIVDAATGAIGGIRRWKTMPWMVILFGIAVGPLSLVSVLLVILQPILFNAWCTLCLASAVISVWMIGPAMDETLASLQYMKKVKESGQSAWKAFWGIAGEN